MIKELIIASYVAVMPGLQNLWQYLQKMAEFRSAMIEMQVDSTEFDSALFDDRFELIWNIDSLFSKSAERLVEEGKQDFEWYKRIVGFKEKSDLVKKHIVDDLDVLTEVEAKYGKPKEVVVSIEAIESSGGRVFGRYSAFNALVSQYILTDRQSFSVRELAALFQFAKRTKYDVFTPSSYAGAMGGMQGIPTSINAYAVNAEGIDSLIDLYDRADNYHFIGNYLSGEDRLNNLDSAIFAYNHSTAYVQVVKALADTARVHLQSYLEMQKLEQKDCDPTTPADTNP